MTKQELHYSKEEYESAQAHNILDYLMQNGYELKNEGGLYFRSKDHSSLVIHQSGQWFWNSKDINGKKPVELLKQLLIHDESFNEKEAYITAIKKLAGTENEPLVSSNKVPATDISVKEDIPKGDIILPPKNKDNKRVFAYLCNTRKLDKEIVQELIKSGKLYETKDHHNACFLSYDKNGDVKHAFMNGTVSYGVGRSFKRDVPNSDKSYGLALEGHPNSNKVFVFENHIEAYSHATLYKMQGLDYKE